MNDRKPSVHHPIFSRILPRINAANMSRGQAEHRRQLLAGLHGRVIEVGAGAGVNFPFYPTSVSEVVAIEPEGHLRGLAAKAAVKAHVPVTVVDGLAEALPAESGSFDAGVASLVLCSVTDQAGALAELHRAIRAAGELRFYEHVKASTVRLARIQSALDAVWPHLAGGCHLSCTTREAIEESGFAVERCDEFMFEPCFLARPGAPHILGVARRA